MTDKKRTRRQTINEAKRFVLMALGDAPEYAEEWSEEGTEDLSGLLDEVEHQMRRVTHFLTGGNAL